MPEGFSVAVPKCVAPSMKVTVPVAFAVELDPLAVTAAVKVTATPKSAGFALEVRLVALATGAALTFTV